MESRIITITSAAHNYGNLNISSCGKEFFPDGVFGGSCKQAGIGTRVSLKVEGLSEPIHTDIPTDKLSGRPRWIFRERSWVKQFVRHHKLRSKDKVMIERISKKKISNKAKKQAINFYRSFCWNWGYAVGI